MFSFLFKSQKQIEMEIDLEISKELREISKKIDKENFEKYVRQEIIDIANKANNFIEIEADLSEDEDYKFQLDNILVIGWDSFHVFLKINNNYINLHPSEEEHLSKVFRKLSFNNQYKKYNQPIKEINYDN